MSAVPEQNYQIIEIGEDYIMAKHKETKWSRSPAEPGTSKTPRRYIAHKRVNTLRSAAIARTPLECFKSFYTSKFFQIVLQHTNEEVEIKKSEYSDKRKKSGTFKLLQSEEFDGLFRFFILAGATKNNHLTARSCMIQQFVEKSTRLPSLLIVSDISLHLFDFTTI